MNIFHPVPARRVPIWKNHSAWAETKIILEVLHKNSNSRPYAQRSHQGGYFLLPRFWKLLDKNPTAKELIFSPFINDFFSEPESAILQSLYSIALEIKAQRISCY